MKPIRQSASLPPAPARQRGRGRAGLIEVSGLARRAATGAREIAQLRTRLADADETLRAIHDGEVDAVVLAGARGPLVFTLQGAAQAYRVLIESMNEGALTLAADETILYANQCFARMVKLPLEQVMGGNFRRFLSPADGTRFRPLLQRTARSGTKLSVLLYADDGTEIPVQLSLRRLVQNGSGDATFGMAVTDLTEARRTEELLRALSQRVVQVQEAERARIALELHDHITQPLCATLLRCQALTETLAACDGPAKREGMKLREMLRRVAEGAERISQNLRPGVLEHLGLACALRDTSRDFARRTGVSVRLFLSSLTVRLPADLELALYRIFQETLKNVECHACARHVTVGLRVVAASVNLRVKDDGIGFAPDRSHDRKNATDGLGLLSMRERATFVGGSLTVQSARRAGTEVEVRVPLRANPRVWKDPGHRSHSVAVAERLSVPHGSGSASATNSTRSVAERLPVPRGSGNASATNENTNRRGALKK